MKISLTEKEWEALQDEVSLYSDLIPNLGEKKEGKIVFEIDEEDLDELLGYVSATANHAETKKLERVLDAVCEKMEAVLNEET